MAIDIVWMLLGLAALVGGGEGLVRGASTLAQRLGIPSLVIGLTVVAFGTSAPELGVSVLAAIEGNADIAVSNVIGSNIFNTLMVLGIPALIRPLFLSLSVLKREVPMLVLTSVLVILMAFYGSQIGRGEAIVLCLGLMAFLGYSCWSSQVSEEGKSLQDEVDEIPSLSMRMACVWVVVGLVLLVVGARWVVGGAAGVAATLGVSQTVIGLTIVAVGTSLPELMASTVAAYKGEGDLAIGNVIGSNLFNLLGILGISGLIVPLQIDPQLLRFDFPWMVLSGLLLLPLGLTQKRISRLEGGILMILYAIYLGWVVRRAIAGPI